LEKGKRIIERERKLVRALRLRKKIRDGGWWVRKEDDSDREDLPHKPGKNECQTVSLPH